MRVNCSGRGIVELDLNVVFASEEERNALAVVKHLDLSRNELRVVNNLQPFSCLSTLDLQHNRITQLAGLPLGLTRLCVAHNELTTLEGLVTLPFLQELDVSNNRLSTLTGLPRTSPLTTLKLGHNRLSNLSGIEAVGNTLQMLELDSNYLCVVEDLRPLSRMKSLQQLSVKDNPLVDSGNHRSMIVSLVPSLLVLDGAAVSENADASYQGSNGLTRGNISPQRRGTTMNDYSTMPPQQQNGGPGLGDTASSFPAPDVALEDSTVTSATSLASSANMRPAAKNGRGAGGASRVLSYESIRQRNDVRRGEVLEDNRKLTGDIDELTRLLDRERLENDKLQRRVRSLEGEVRDLRKVMAEELNKLTLVRQENDALRVEVDMQKKRTEKISRDYKYCREKVKLERVRRVEELEKAKVSHQAVVHSLRARLQEYADTGRSTTDAEHALREEVLRLQDLVQDLERENGELTLSLSNHGNATHLEDYSEATVGKGGRSGRVVAHRPEDVDGPIFPQSRNGRHPQQRQQQRRGGGGRAVSTYYPDEPEEDDVHFSGERARHGRRPYSPREHDDYDDDDMGGPDVDDVTPNESGAQDDNMMDFATQLRDWLVTELNERNRSTSMDTPQQQQSPIQQQQASSSTSPAYYQQQQQQQQYQQQQQASSSYHQSRTLSPPRSGSSSSGVLDEVWARNESILGASKLHRTK
eukprot:PhM_4_TR17919/c1_g1_i1/m.10921